MTGDVLHEGVVLVATAAFETLSTSLLMPDVLSLALKLFSKISYFYLCPEGILNWPIEAKVVGEVMEGNFEVFNNLEVWVFLAIALSWLGMTPMASARISVILGMYYKSTVPLSFICTGWLSG
eukprot:CAMPEP_0204920110 /NCGR_PEP_ID=MMETSP1397-20131031/17193_1 /ASSEMBLY_ACC=CAM_ASM_000891 /TAXON_ID=49980 /ORGANISM="Climacostomum Climacostomum virens, Strain Stock W-24" /LENGTH=122 /DNA_ID=CAMNT_0052093769 /DNA_START=841 /DNA_END=1209 /DNA_ORIENTATION=-